jgi:HEPN domain-containing protein
VPDESWRAWWSEAEEQLATARELLSLKRHASAVFHAHMALELALKAIRLAPSRLEHLKGVTIGELKGYTIGQLGGLPLDKQHGLEAIADAPWHPRAASGVAAKQFAEIAADLGIQAKALYMATRYPDWPSGLTIPHERFSEVHSSKAIDAATAFLEPARRHLQGD